MERVVKPQRAFVHPLWIASLALLVVNDHLLKGAGVLPGWLTGKLSDFAGLVVAPLVLGAVIFASSRASLRWAHVAVGAGFAAIKIFPAAAGAVEALMAVTPLPWTITVDPTDLIALPMLLVSYAVLVPATEQPAAVRPVVERVAFMAGGLACAATSAPNPCSEDPSQCQSPPSRPTEQASLVLANTTSATRLVRVRPLRDTVIADCGAVMADPTAALARDLFGPAESWLLEPGRALPLQNDDCDVYLVDADGLDMTLLAWRGADFPTANVSTSTSFRDPERTIDMRLSEQGKLVLDGHAAVFDAPPVESEPPPPACAVPDSSVGVDWSIASFGAPIALVGITSSPDGCHAFDFGFTEGYVCAPIEALPFTPGDMITIEERSEDAGTVSLQIISDKFLVRIVRGDVAGIFGGAALPSLEIAASASPLPGCPSHHDACGSLVAPLELTIAGGEGVETTFLQAGQQAAIPAAGATLHLVRAQEMPVRDTECPPFAFNSQYIESVYVIEQGVQE
jgi:hypothetical protein